MQGSGPATNSASLQFPQMQLLPNPPHTQVPLPMETFSNTMPPSLAGTMEGGANARDPTLPRVNGLDMATNMLSLDMQASLGLGTSGGDNLNGDGLDGMAHPAKR